MKELKPGSSFDNRLKETKKALEWFRENTYVVDNELYWGESVGTTRKRSKVHLNKKAGCTSPRGYIQVRNGKEKFMAHRIIWALHYGEWPESGIDHINGDRLDNRIENMRDESQFSNCKNAAKYPRKESWIATGVNRSNNNKWIAHAQVNKIKISIGRFNCYTAALLARKLFDKDNGFSDRHGAEYRVY